MDAGDGTRVFRYTEPLYVTESCLECHGVGCSTSRLVTKYSPMKAATIMNSTMIACCIMLS